MRLRTLEGESNPRSHAAEHQVLSLQGRESAGRVAFRPEHARFMVWHTADVEVAATMCMKCGAVSLTDDVEKMHALVEESKAAADTP